MKTKTTKKRKKPIEMGINHLHEAHSRDAGVVVVLPSAQQVPLKRLLYCAVLTFFLLIQPPRATYCARKLADADHGDQQQTNYRHYQESSGDTGDISSQDTSDQSPYESTGSSELTEERPPPPNELSVIRMNDTSVVLRWEFPENSQDSLQFFKVQHKSTSRKTASEGWKTDNQEVPTTTRAYQINGLRPGNFLFSVIAVYENDDNVPSTPLKFKIRAKSKIKPEEMPEMKAPHIYWTEAESDYFRFKWKYDPKDNDTEYFGFLVFYRSAHAVSDFTIHNTMDTSVEIAQVESDTPYEAKVVAYNTVGVSEFSETISIRTKSRQNAASPPPTTTQSPISSTSISASTIASATSTTNAPTESASVTTTRRPSFPSVPTTYNTATNTPYRTGNATYLTTSKPNGSAHNSTSVYQTISSLFDSILVDQSDAMLIVRYLLLILLPLLFIIIILIFVIKPHTSKKNSPSESSSSDGSMQFDLEINGYFKNSFPGVEKDYPGACINVHNGFVNDHPHIDDST